MGARAAGMGYASVVLSDESSLFNNVGAIAEVQRPATLFLYEARPSLPGAQSVAAGIVAPLKFGVLGAGVFRFGDDLYSEQVLSAAFGNKFGNTSLGMSLNYVQYRAENFGTKGALYINFGGRAQITPQISVGAYIVNLTQANVAPDELLPVKFVAGLGFKPDAHFLIVTEVEKDISYQATWKLGAEYAIYKKIFIRTGFNLNPHAAYFGLGAQVKHLKMDYAISLSTVLGAIHCASATYMLESKKK